MQVRDYFCILRLQWQFHFQRLCDIILLGLPRISAGTTREDERGLSRATTWGLSVEGSLRPAVSQGRRLVWQSPSARWPPAAPLTLRRRRESQDTRTKRLPQLGHFLWWGSSCQCQPATWHLSLGGGTLRPSRDGEHFTGQASGCRSKAVRRAPLSFLFHLGPGTPQQGRGAAGPAGKESTRPSCLLLVGLPTGLLCQWF